MVQCKNFWDLFQNGTITKQYYARHSLLRAWFRQNQIFGNQINDAFSEGSFPMESHDLFKKIPTCYSPTIIFSNYFWQNTTYLA